MKLFLYSFIFILVFSAGCSVNAKESVFVSERNYDVGRSVDLIYVKPSKVLSYSVAQDKYFFEWDNGCKFTYYVNKSTKKVESWEYISSPEKCTLGFAWGSPW